MLRWRRKLEKVFDKFQPQTTISPGHQNRIDQHFTGWKKRCTTCISHEHFLGIVTVFFALANAKETNLPKFASYAFMQIAVFVFMIIQFNRGFYLLVVRNHLSKLESIMQANAGNNDNLIFEWESRVVPNKISPSKSYSSRSQLVIGIIYFGIFVILCCKSIQHSLSLHPKDIIFPMWTIWVYYLGILPFELFFIFYSLRALVKQKNV